MRHSVVENRILGLAIRRAQNVTGNVLNVNLVAVVSVDVPVDDDDVTNVGQPTV